MLTDGVDPLFEHWLAKMRGKLRSNADHYPTKILRMNYIENRCDGAAMGHLTPSRRKDTLKLFALAKKCMTY